MGVNKVDLANGETLIDLQNDTVTPETLAKGKTAHNAQGEQIIGKMEQTVAKEEIEINVPTITRNGHYELTAPEGKVISKANVEVAVPTQGGGSGIIEVPELPTENIDENAIYKVVVDEESTFYIIRNGTIIDEKTFLQSVGLKEVYKYFVDELPADMLETDTSTGITHGYVINSTGVVYLKVKGPGVILTIGEVAFSNVGYDKGYTTDITLETQDGVYVQKGKHSEDWFYRESGEWVRITPEQENKQFTLATPLKKTVTPEEGKVFSSVTVDVGFKSIGDFIDRNFTIEKITENDLTKTDGKALTYIRECAFSYASVKSITLPSTIINVYSTAFEYAEVEEVTFKGRPNSLNDSLFSTCANLRTLNVSWGNGQVSGAPWGATNATINYNYTGE